jgi:hypothetical protein
MSCFFSAKRQHRSHDHGRRPEGLAANAGPVGAGYFPRFPPSILYIEDKLRGCVAAGDTVGIEFARTELSSSLRALLESDEKRLSGLPDASAHDREREFLTSRLVLVEARLSDLQVRPEPVEDAKPHILAPPPPSTLGNTAVEGRENAAAA